MDICILVLFILINIFIITFHLLQKGDYIKLPFWIAAINLGWFTQMAVGCYVYRGIFPSGMYGFSIFFALLCTLALWHGFSRSVKKKLNEKLWLQEEFDPRKLVFSSFMMMAVGLYFYYKLWQLPEELLAISQWSGITVRYLFLSGVFKIGMIALLLIAFKHEKINKKALLLALPGILIMAEAVLMRGRRSVATDLVVILLGVLWFTREKALPRSCIAACVIIGGVLVINIGVYRSIMKQNVPLSTKIEELCEVNYNDSIDELALMPHYEFKNYLYGTTIALNEFTYDCGLSHWNSLIFNYVPAQIVGSGLKSSFMVDYDDPVYTYSSKYGHAVVTGATMTGYLDAFLSFSILGFIKFWLIGWISGRLFAYAKNGAFLAQILYIISIVPAMQAVSHTTNDFLVRIWIYFFVMGYPFILLARQKKLIPKKENEYGRIREDSLGKT